MTEKVPKDPFSAETLAVFNHLATFACNNIFITWPKMTKKGPKTPLQLSETQPFFTIRQHCLAIILAGFSLKSWLLKIWPFLPERRCNRGL